MGTKWQFSTLRELRRWVSRTSASRGHFGRFRGLFESPLGHSSEGQRGPRRLDILQDGDLKGTGAGHTFVPKDNSERRKINLAEQRDSFLLSSR